MTCTDILFKQTHNIENLNVTRLPAHQEEKGKVERCLVATLAQTDRSWMGAVGLALALSRRQGRWRAREGCQLGFGLSLSRP